MHFFNSHEGTAAKRLRSRRNITSRVQHDARLEIAFLFDDPYDIQFTISIDLYGPSKCSRLHSTEYRRDYTIHGSDSYLQAVRIRIFLSSARYRRTSGNLLMLRLPRPTRRPSFRHGLQDKANKQELNLEGFTRSDIFMRIQCSK